MALPFLKAESEETATQAIAFVAIVIITIGLATMNVMGVLAGSQGSSLGQLIIRGALAVIVCGAELLGAVILVRVMLAPNWWRRVAGAIIFLGVAWACIQNGKRAVHLIYPEFAESSALLEARAGIAETDDKDLQAAKAAALLATPAELANVRTRIATLEGHQELMQAKSPEKIMEAQRLLTITGDYVGEIDGKAERLTESAMRAYGEEVGKELKTLRQRETNLSNGTVIVPPVAGSEPVKSPAVLKAEYEDKARKAASATIWLEVMLWVFELARSFGLWALVATITSRNRRKDDVKEIVLDETAGPAPAGFVDMRFSNEEWAEYERAMEKHRNHAEGVKNHVVKKKRGTKVAANEEAYRNKIADFMEDHNNGLTLGAIAQKWKMSPEALRLTYMPYMTEEEYAALFFAAPAEPEPEAPAEEAPEEPVAVADSPQADEELEIPPEPQEWPMAPYEPPANDDPDSKEAA